LGGTSFSPFAGLCGLGGVFRRFLTVVSKISVSSGIGLLHISWSTFEITLEILSQRLLGITTEQSHILFSSLGAKAKKEIAVSLTLNSKIGNQDDIVKSIRKILDIASRNHIFHSVMFTNFEKNTVDFVKRDISNDLKLKKKEFGGADFYHKIHELADECINLQALCGISDDDLMAYADHVKTTK
jgi:hypothetical protein